MGKKWEQLVWAWIEATVSRENLIYYSGYLKETLNIDPVEHGLIP